MALRYYADAEDVINASCTDIIGGGGAGFEEFKFSTSCFTRGTLIKTFTGEIEIEKLTVGDRVITMDRGYQPIRWIGSTTHTRNFLKHNRKLKPIQIDKGALGFESPAKTLRVSPQQRILIRSKISKQVFGTEEVLLPANELLPLGSVRVVEDESNVEYWHIMFDQHEILWSNGAPSESLFTGPEAFNGLSVDLKDEINAIFPEIANLAYEPKSARLIPKKGKDLKKLIMRHILNQKPLMG
jgi:hypothetical protein